MSFFCGLLAAIIMSVASSDHERATHEAYCFWLSHGHSTACKMFNDSLNPHLDPCLGLDPTPDSQFDPHACTTLCSPVHHGMTDAHSFGCDHDSHE